MIGVVPRRCVNLPRGSLRTLLRSVASGTVVEGGAVEEFYREFGRWVGAPYVFGTGSGRSAFEVALQALGLERGAEIIFPVLTFPVIPLVAKTLGYEPVFCDVDPVTFNSGPEHIAPRITDRTGAILATHLFGRPCPIDGIVALARPRNLRVIEDCAHACGVRIGGKRAGTFGDIGVFSFAEGKNMPCFGGGAIVTADERIADRARVLLENAAAPDRTALVKHAAAIWAMWLFTRPFAFGLTVYPMLRLRLALGQPLLDSKVGDDLLSEFAHQPRAPRRFANLQAAVGLLQLQQIDAFNRGAQENARALTHELGRVAGVGIPDCEGEDHIYVYYPLRIDPARRDALRHHLLRHGIDAKNTDMANCASLSAFRQESRQIPSAAVSAAALLEICVYPVIPKKLMGKIARAIRSWARKDGLMRAKEYPAQQ